MNRPFVKVIGAKDFRGSFVFIKLTSIEHQAKRGAEVDQEFDVEGLIADGINPLGTFQASDLKIPPGSQVGVDTVLFKGDYSNGGPPPIQFTFSARTDYAVGVFDAKTEGDDALEFGVQYFVIPVALTAQGGRESTLLFRGRIDVSR